MVQQVKEFESLVEVLEDMDKLGIEGVQRYRAMNQYLALKARYQDIPLSGSFELTPLCNLDCKMCYVHLNTNQLSESERLLNIDEWKSIAKQCVDAGMMYVTLTGGECLVYPQFKELYRYIVSLGIQPDLITNGLMLNEEMIDFFSQYPPGIIQISLYGSNDDAYENVTGHRAFHQVMDGIARAKKAGLNVVIAITPNRFMQKDTRALLNVLYSLHLPYVIGSSTLPARSETAREIDDYAIDSDAFFRMKQINEEYCNSLPERAPARLVPKYVPKKRGELAGLPCGGAHCSFHVNWKGEICPCIAFAPAVSCSILQNGFSKAWDSIRKTMLAYKPPKECISCMLRDYCKSCPGEKGMCQLEGVLNPRVCEKLKRDIDEGNIAINSDIDCDGKVGGE